MEEAKQLLLPTQDSSINTDSVEVVVSNSPELESTPDPSQPQHQPQPQIPQMQPLSQPLIPSARQAFINQLGHGLTKWSKIGFKFFGIVGAAAEATKVVQDQKVTYKDGYDEAKQKADSDSQQGKCYNPYKNIDQENFEITTGVRILIQGGAIYPVTALLSLEASILLVEAIKNKNGSQVLCSLTMLGAAWGLSFLNSNDGGNGLAKEAGGHYSYDKYCTNITLGADESDYSGPTILAPMPDNFLKDLSFGACIAAAGFGALGKVGEIMQKYGHEELPQNFIRISQIYWD